MAYAIKFDYPEGDTLYAGMHKGAFGWAPSIETALIYDDVETAERVLQNCYGKASEEYASIVTAEAGKVEA